jgi:4'-phosphopantetheinyl transferase
MPVSTMDAWAPGPLRPLLAEGAIHVWRADLAAVAEDLGGLLSGEERGRAERLLSEHDRVLWVRSRGLLRALLGRYLRRDPRSLRFTAGAHGKPELVDDADGPPPAGRTSLARQPRLSFNMSHSGQLALYAFGDATAIGVDVEVARRPIDEVAIATRMFGAAEAQRLGDLDPAVRRREFLRAWVRHEAQLKCLGVGIGGADATVRGRGLWVAQLELGTSAAGAVAGERRPHELRFWDWRTRDPGGS